MLDVAAPSGYRHLMMHTVTPHPSAARPNQAPMQQIVTHHNPPARNVRRVQFQLQ